MGLKSKINFKIMSITRKAQGLTEMVLNISIKTILGTFRSNISICLFKRVNCSV